MSNDTKNLIRIASQYPVGHPVRRSILAAVSPKTEIVNVTVPVQVTVNMPIEVVTDGNGKLYGEQQIPKLVDVRRFIVENPESIASMSPIDLKANGLNKRGAIGAQPSKRQHLADQWIQQFPTADEEQLRWLAHYGEANTPADTADMLIWDLGYQGDRMYPWLKEIARFFKVDPDKRYMDGQKARQ